MTDSALVWFRRDLRLPTGMSGAAELFTELIWREFYQMILWHRPDVVDHAFKPEYDRLAWDDPPGHFATCPSCRTCQTGLSTHHGRCPHQPAGYPAPIVDHAVARERTLARFTAVRGKA